MIDVVDLFPQRGTVTHVTQTHVVADGPLVGIGSLCRLDAGDGRECLAQVSAIDLDRVVLMPLDRVDDLRPGVQVTADSRRRTLPVGDGFAGRAVDGLGRPIDGGAPVTATVDWSDRQPVAVLDRETPKHILPTGINAIDMFLTLGVGQRIGVFSASGVGKSSLIQQLSRQIIADHVVICLVGERGREVEAFWQEHLAGATDSNVTIVAATSDAPAPMRVRAVDQALAIADYWRSVGRHCLLIVDSITRYAMALREIGLAAGEPPTLRGYTPNVLSALPQVVEQCGRKRGGGAITGLFTVLAETDDVDDPIVEVMKSLLDGHIILSRTLAQLGHFPAIDVLKSVSRLASGLTNAQQTADARTVVQLLARYEEARMLIESGLYVKGSDPEIDEAVSRRPAIMEFLKQDITDHHQWDDGIRCLAKLHRGGLANG